MPGNDLYQGITRKLPYRQMVTPYGVQVTFAKTVHIIFPSAVLYVDLGSNYIIVGKADGAENVIRVKATTEGFLGETNFSVICEDGSFYSVNAKYAHEPEMLNIEMKDFLENEVTSDFSHTRINIYFRELENESPLLVKLIMQSIYKNNGRKIRHLGSKQFGILAGYKDDAFEKLHKLCGGVCSTFADCTQIQLEVGNEHRGNLLNGYILQIVSALDKVARWRRVTSYVR